MNRDDFERNARERREAIADRYDQLRSYRRAGDEFGISGQRVQQIVKRVKQERAAREQASAHAQPLAAPSIRGAKPTPARRRAGGR